ncbi:MAG TPA: acetamidase/formamidase family protein [Solirubrobacteraceae bacterium]|nr:acetamidase/formamidase family protein [Solirubrobacteraceae bacterium]
MSGPTLELKRSAGLLYTLGRDHPPVLSVEPGTRVRIETELNIGDVLHHDGDVFSADMVRPPWLNSATGPIEIRGATNEHVVVCDIERIDVHSPGLTGLVPGLSPFTDWIREREFGVHANVVPIADGLIQWPGGRPIPVRPMVGVIGCAPLVEAVSTVDNGRHGGNLDVQEIGPGCRVFLPVAVDGALFALGDCHARQGDGELCGLGGIECRTDTTVRLDLGPRPAEMRWPRIETDTQIGVIACARPLEDAFRLAVRDLVEWMAADYDFTVETALMLLGQVAEARATQIVNPKYTYIVKVDKHWLGRD